MNDNTTSHISIDSKKVISRLLTLLLLTACSLVLLDAFVNYGKLTTINQLRRLLNITREDGIATWFSVAQFLCMSLTVFFIALVSKSDSESSKESYIWFIIACFFLFVSVDDAAEVHERIGSAFKAISERGGGQSPLLGEILDQFPSYPWQLLVAPIYLFIGAMLTVFFWKRFNTKTLRIFLLLCIVCNGAALSLDFVEGIKKGHAPIEDALSLDYYTVRHFSKSLEEFLEMIGASFLWMAFLTYLFQMKEQIHIKIK